MYVVKNTKIHVRMYGKLKVKKTLFTFLAVNNFSTGTNSLNKCDCVSVVKLASSKLNSRQTSIVNNTHPLVSTYSIEKPVWD